MAITAAITDSFKTGILQGIHEASDTYKIALYPSAATLSNATTAYSSTNEVANGNGYATGGAVLSGYNVTGSGNTAILDWSTDPSWAAATITARGALIYNFSQANASVAVLDFGSDIVSSAGTFTVTFPANTSTSGLIRVG
jgi:hypothetical protein